MLAYVIFGIISLIAAIGTLLSIAVVADRVRVGGETKLLQWISILVIIGGTALPALIRILSGLDVDDPRSASYDGSNIAAVIWLKRFFTGSILLLTTAGLLRRFTGLLDQRAPGASLMFAYLAYAILSLVIGAIFSTKPALLPALYYSVFVLVLVFAAKQADLEKVIETIKFGLRLILIGSLVLAVAMPAWAFTKSANSMLPGLSERLVGLTSHPNVLGPLALLYLVLDSGRSRPRAWEWVMRLAAVLIIVLAQSKTVWVASILVVAAIVVMRIFGGGRFFRRAASGWLILTALLGCTMIVMVLLLVATFGLHQLENLPGFRNVLTLVGRSEIWSITISLWEQSPMFGYGPTLWSPEFRHSYSMLYVGQAHNQFIQTLGDSGLVGLFGLTIYVFSLLAYGLRLAAVSQGMTVGLAVLILIRSFTETPMRSLGVADPTFLMHFIVFATILYWSRVAIVRENRDMSL